MRQLRQSALQFNFIAYFSGTYWLQLDSLPFPTAPISNSCTFSFTGLRGSTLRFPCQTLSGQWPAAAKRQRSFRPTMIIEWATMIIESEWAATPGNVSLRAASDRLITKPSLGSGDSRQLHFLSVTLAAEFPLWHSGPSPSSSSVPFSYRCGIPSSTPRPS